MTGPTWKFWTWTADDWPYGIAIAFIGCACLASILSFLGVL